MRLTQFDLEELGPSLAGHEQAVALGVVGDAVEDVGLVVAIGGCQQAAGVDPADHFAGSGVDAGDAIGLVDVGVDFALHPFEFVQFGDRPAIGGDGNAAGFLEGFGIPEAQFGGAIAHDDALAIGGEPPAFAGVGKFAFGGETGEIVDESLFGLPGQFEQAVLPNDDAFAEILAGDVAVLQHLAGLQFHLANARFLVHAGALVEHAVAIEQSLGVRCAVVRVGMHDLVRVLGNSTGLRGRSASAGTEGRKKYECPHLHQISVPRKRYRWLAY